ncbi:MAG: hypothetical protein NTU97_00515 [Candidatus Magasanikbacteria bacterium]|nr:hypothetical protein [Candidatus Magasanikbacteria bacterium]
MSEGRPTFIQGLDRVTPKEAKRFVARAERLKKEGLKPKEQEFEKTPEQQRDIILLNSFLAAEFVDLGVENFETFEPVA